MGAEKMRFYVSKCHNSLNSVDYTPEKYSDYICINPYYPVKITNDANFIIDSGAFQDVGKQAKRLEFQDALKRQLDFEKTVTDNHRKAEAIVSYDHLVDEQYDEGRGQFKERVQAKVSRKYVAETIDAAKFLAENREELAPRRLILSCQGTTVNQYLYCVNKILEIADEDDIIGLGGFCIISKSKIYEEQFYNVINKAFPKIEKKGIRRVHIFGVGLFRALIQADICAHVNGLECSYDTSSCEMNSVFGKMFDPQRQVMSKVFSRNQKYEAYLPAKLAEFNISTMLDFWKKFNEEFDYPEKFKAMPLKDNKRTNR